MMIRFFIRFIKQDRKKARSRRGFSLAEMLVVLIIIGLLTAAIAGGSGVVRNVYRNITVKANAEVAESTAIRALQNYMRFAGSYLSGTSGSGTSETASGNASSGETAAGASSSRSFVDMNTGYRMRIYNRNVSPARVYVQYLASDGTPLAESAAGSSGAVSSGTDGSASGMIQPLIPDASFGTTLGSGLEMYMVPADAVSDSATAADYRAAALKDMPSMDANGTFSFGLVVLNGDTVMAQEKVTIHSLNAGS